MKRIFILLTALFSVAPLLYSQQTPPPEVVSLLNEDPDRAAVNLHVYEFDPIVDTRPPKGYEPFYISHYGRHGTRSEGRADAYLYVITRLEKADSLGILTEEGKSLLAEARAVNDAFGGREGRLTPRGQREHRMLAERMYRRFPGVFRSGSGNVRVQSSIVPRCLVSMASFIAELSACNLQLIFYRSRKGGPVLVKFLVNEKETLLRGLTPVQGPYYDWSLVRDNLAGWQR